MDNIDTLVGDALRNFREVAALADAEFSAESIVVEISLKPHRQPKGLPAGTMAVYAFFKDGRALKVGKVGPKSAARYTAQHYSPNSANSNLARSILANPTKVGATGVDALAIGDWIKRFTDRVNLIVPVGFGNPMLSLLESYLHVRWKPTFEGRISDV